MLIDSSKLLITGIIIILFQMIAFSIGPWELKYPTQVYDFTDLAENDSTIVVTGLKNAMFVSSHDTIWNEVPVDGMPIMRSIIWYKDRFVSVGDSGAIYSSLNGRQWTKHTSGVTVQLSCIYGDTTNSLLMAVGLNGTLLKSTDGETWNIQSCDLKSNFRQVLYDGRDWVIVANVDTILYSADANAWVVKDIDSTESDVPIMHLASSGMKLLGVTGIGSIKCGTDCETWSGFANTGFPNGTQCFWNGDAWIITSDETGYIEAPSISSIDLVTWKQVGPERIVRCAKFDGGRSLYITRRVCEPFFSNIMTDTAFLYNSVVFNDLNASAGNGKSIVVVGDSGVILTTEDFALWENYLSPTNKNINGVTWNGTKFIAVGDSGTIISSTDGTSWSVVPCSTSNDLIGILSTPDINLAYGKQISLTSKNGIDWNVHTFDTTVNIFKMVKTDTSFLGVSPYQIYTIRNGMTSETRYRNMIVTSKNGTEWINYYREGQITDISYSEKFGVVTVSTAGYRFTIIYCSSSKLNVGKELVNGNVVASYGGPGNIIVMCNFNYVFTTNDGVSWVETSLPYWLGHYNSCGESDVHDIHYANGHYVAVGTYGRAWVAKGDEYDTVKPIQKRTVIPIVNHNCPLHTSITQSNITIEYDFPTTRWARFELHSLNGKLMQVVDEGYKQPGRHKLLLGKKGFRSGVYLLTVKTDRLPECKTVLINIVN